MAKITEQWIEIDDTHVKHVMEATYTKEELNAKMGYFLRPTPVQIIPGGQTSIEDNSNKTQEALEHDDS